MIVILSHAHHTFPDYTPNLDCLIVLPIGLNAVGNQNQHPQAAASSGWKVLVYLSNKKITFVDLLLR